MTDSMPARKSPPPLKLFGPPMRPSAYGEGYSRRSEPHRVSAEPEPFDYRSGDPAGRFTPPTAEQAEAARRVLDDPAAAARIGRLIAEIERLEAWSSGLYQALTAIADISHGTNLVQLRARLDAVRSIIEQAARVAGLMGPDALDCIRVILHTDIGQCRAAALLQNTLH